MLPVNATHQIAVMGALSAIEAQAVNLNDLVERLPIPRPALVAAAGRLVARGLVERAEDGVYRLSPAGSAALVSGLKIGGDPARRRKHPLYADSLRQRAWRAMRLSIRFTAGDIVALAARDEIDAEDSIRRFCHQLVRADYLAELPTRTSPERPGDNGRKQWRMVRDTGELAPQYMAASKAFRDRNTGEVAPCR